jgi:restriction endonuclease Mrr
MLPVLKASTAGEVKISDVVTTLGKQLALSDDELSELLPSGKQTTFANRVCRRSCQLHPTSSSASSCNCLWPWGTAAPHLKPARHSGRAATEAWMV